jgi:tripartite-type tricarboxylate transporter receptor subunit TctC
MKHSPSVVVYRGAQALALLWAWAIAAPAPAQSYPHKPVRLVVPFSPGASTDIAARVVAHRLSESFGQQFIVENRAGGAGGTVGAASVARSAADGYTLMMANSSVLNVAPHVYKKLPYDALRDFAPIALVAWVPLMLTVHPSLPAADVKALVALARSRPGQLSFSSSGVGSSLHLAGELFKTMGNLDIVHIPYKGASNAMIDVVAGEVQLTFAAVATALPYIKQGRARPLAVTTQKRFALFPDVPTMAEAGFPRYQMLNWLGVVAPAQTPPEVVQRLNAEIAKWAAQDESREKMIALGVDIGGGTPQEYAAILAKGYTLIGEIAKRAGIEAQ